MTILTILIILVRSGKTSIATLSSSQQQQEDESVIGAPVEYLWSPQVQQESITVKCKLIPTQQSLVSNSPVKLYREKLIQFSIHEVH